MAFGLLGLLGAKTLRDGLSDEPTSGAILSGWALLGAAVATSLDAAAAGVTLPSLGTNVALACAVIGGVTLGLWAAGVFSAPLEAYARQARRDRRRHPTADRHQLLIEQLYFGG